MTDGNGKNSASHAFIFIAACNYDAPWSGFGFCDDHRDGSDEDDDDRCRLIITSGNNDAAAYDNINWERFHQFLLTHMNQKTANDRLRYARQFYHVFQTGNAYQLLLLTPEKRLHVMKSLSSLSRFLGCYDIWLQLKQQYNLKWAIEGSTLRSFELMFDESRSINKMMEWVRYAMSWLPDNQANTLLFAVLTGLRPSEAIDIPSNITTKNVAY